MVVLLELKVVALQPVVGDHFDHFSTTTTIFRPLRPFSSHFPTTPTVFQPLSNHSDHFPATTTTFPTTDHRISPGLLSSANLFTKQRMIKLPSLVSQFLVFLVRTKLIVRQKMTSHNIRKLKAGANLFCKNIHVSFKIYQIFEISEILFLLSWVCITQKMNFGRHLLRL